MTSELFSPDNQASHVRLRTSKFCRATPSAQDFRFYANYNPLISQMEVFIHLNPLLSQGGVGIFRRWFESTLVPSHGSPVLSLEDICGRFNLSMLCSVNNLQPEVVVKESHEEEEDIWLRCWSIARSFSEWKTRVRKENV